MAEVKNLIVPSGEPESVYINQYRFCCFCGNGFKKRARMWKYPDGNFLCPYCKKRFEEDAEKGVTFSDGQEAIHGKRKEN